MWIRALSQAGKPGLKVDKWISNGTDSLELLYGTTELDVRLYPTNLVRQTSSTTERISYRSVIETLDTRPDGGIFSSECIGWLVADGIRYGNVGTDEYVFEVENGKAVSLTPRALRRTLMKID